MRTFCEYETKNYLGNNNLIAIQKTEIGLFVNKLRKNPDLPQEAKDVAKEIVISWKEVIHNQGKFKVKTESKNKHEVYAIFNNMGCVLF